MTFLAEAEEELRNITVQFQFIDWEYSTNITDENEKKKNELQVSARFFAIPGVNLIKTSRYLFRLPPLSAPK